MAFDVEFDAFRSRPFRVLFATWIWSYRVPERKWLVIKEGMTWFLGFRRKQNSHRMGTWTQLDRQHSKEAVFIHLIGSIVWFPIDLFRHTDLVSCMYVIFPHAAWTRKSVASLGRTHSVISASLRQMAACYFYCKVSPKNCFIKQRGSLGVSPSKRVKISAAITKAAAAHFEPSDSTAGWQSSTSRYADRGIKNLNNTAQDS